MNTVDPLDLALHERLAARPLVLLLDVDGTLSPIAPTPESATVPDRTRHAIARLVRGERVHVALVSGRAARDARRLVGVDGVWAIGNHGFETITPQDDLVTDPGLAPYRAHIAEAAAAIAPIVAAHPGTQLEDKTWTLSIHYRRAGAGVDELLRHELERIGLAHGLKLTAGKMVFELRPPVPVDKGTASVALLDRLLGASGGAALYAGDDRTDEDAFRALRSARPEAVTVRIAPENDEAPAATAAEFLLSGVGAMGAFLDRLAEAVHAPAGS